MQYKSYFPGLHISRDLNLDTNGSKWPLYNADKTLGNVYYYNGFIPPPVQDQELLYGKEVIKQTILKHENIFRDQVRELHRLYNRQKEIMDEIRRKELHGHYIPPETLQKNPFKSQVLFDYSQKTLNIPSVPCINPACIGSSVSAAEIIKPSLHSSEGKGMHTGNGFTQTEGSSKGSKMLESKCQNVQKKMLDLQLPASEYLDSEEDEEEKVCDVPKVTKSPPKTASEVLPDSDVKLPDHLGGVYGGEASSSKPSLSKITGLFDLNEPFQLEEVISLNPVPFLGPDPNLRVPCPDLSGKTNKSLQVLSHNTQTKSDIEDCSNSKDRDKKKMQCKWQACNEEAGKNSCEMNSFAQGFGREQLPTSSESSELGPTEAREISMSLLLVQSNRESRDERRNVGSEVSDRKQGISKNNHLKRVGASESACSSYQLVPHTANSESSTVSVWRKPTHVIKRNPIAVQALPCFSSPAPFCKSSISSVGSSRLIGEKIKIKKRVRSTPNSTEASTNKNGRFHGSSLKSKTTKTRSPSTKFNYPKCDNDWCPVEEVCEQDTPTMDEEKKVEDPPGGLPLLRGNPISEGNPKKGIQDLIPLRSGSLQDFSSRIHGVGSKKVEGGNFPKDQIELSSCMNECESSSKSVIPRLALKSAAEIDLEAPISPENEECSPPRGESDENLLDMDFQYSGPAGGDDPEKELLRLAAKTIVSISSCGSSEVYSGKTLHWFAGIVTSMEGGLGKELNDEDGFDYFEVMTLKLAETKIDEPLMNGNGQKEEDKDDLLSRRKTKGRTRRGRQLKDFQSEVLPCLASLSRYEVTEDLQTIEGLVNAAAAAAPDETGLARRNGGRDGWTRGRRRRRSSCSLASYMEESTSCAALKQETKIGELGLDERILTGWGKITRRRRGPRFPATNLPLIISQV